MVSKPVTPRSISQSALLISLLVAACGGGKSGEQTVPVGTEVQGEVTLAFVGGDVRTMDPARPAATAIALVGNRIALVGSDAEVRARAGATAKIIELNGKTVTPGLVDAHCHLYGLGEDLENVSLRDHDSEAATIEALVVAARDRVPGEWLVGRGWDQNRWPGQQWPTAASIDAVLSDRPVVLHRIDGHAAWLNSRALAAAGITASTKDPSGGKILRDAAGKPTGVLVDNAVDLVAKVVPEPDAAHRERRIRAAIQVALANGLTGVHEMGIGDATADVYTKLASNGELPLHVYAFLAGDPAKNDRVRVSPGEPVGNFSLRGVKYFVDGALGSRGARLVDEYEDDPGNVGLWVTDYESLNVAVNAAVSGGWQVAVHAIGDAGIETTLDAFDATQQMIAGEHRLRVEHAQVMARPLFDRMVNARAVASMQPTHATSDMPWAELRVGGGRIKFAYAWRAMLDKGIPLAFGSDFPVEGVNPLLGLYAAVTRQDAAGNPTGGWYPSQKLTLDEAIRAFTVGSAYAQFAEDTRGKLAAGFAADLTIFDRALAPDSSLLQTKVAWTIVDGAIAYEAK